MAGARSKPWWEHLLDYYVRPMSDWLTLGLAETGWHQYDVNRSNQDQQINDIVAGVNNGSLNPTDALGELASNGLKITPELEKYFDNLIAQQNAKTSHDWSVQDRDSSYLSTAEQLSALGLSPAGVLQAGAMSTSAPVADNSKSNVALERYQQNMAISRQMLGMVSAMAGAGIHGHAIAKARESAANIAADTAITVQHMRNKFGSQPVITQFDPKNRKIVKQSVANFDDSWSWL